MCSRQGTLGAAVVLGGHRALCEAPTHTRPSSTPRHRSRTTATPSTGRAAPTRWTPTTACPRGGWGRLRRCPFTASAAPTSRPAVPSARPPVLKAGCPALPPAPPLPPPQRARAPAVAAEAAGRPAQRRRHPGRARRAAPCLAAAARPGPGRRGHRGRRGGVAAAPQVGGRGGRGLQGPVAAASGMRSLRTGNSGRLPSGAAPRCPCARPQAAAQRRRRGPQLARRV
jgi:hypothetical protein